MSERLQQGVDRGELPRECDPVALAAFFNTVFRGMAVQARDGANRERLLQIGRLAMRVLASVRSRKSRGSSACPPATF